jgi:dTDP-4-dehydrorhamnose 3,5-epimerase
MDNYYQPRFESGIIWNDPDVGIEWPFPEAQLSERDSKQTGFKEFCQKYPHLQF